MLKLFIFIFCILLVCGIAYGQKSKIRASAFLADECSTEYLPPPTPYPTFVNRWDDYTEEQRLWHSRRGVITILQRGEPFQKEFKYETDAKDCFPASFLVATPHASSVQYPGVRNYYLTAGTYTVVQTEELGFMLHTLTCTEDITQDSIINLVQRRVIFNLQPYETITCSFTNYRRPTSAPVSITGIITNTLGRPQSQARVALIDLQTGNTRVSTSSSFGYYKFDNVSTQRIYQIEVTARGLYFEPKQILLSQDEPLMNFKAK